MNPSRRFNNDFQYPYSPDDEAEQQRERFGRWYDLIVGTAIITTFGVFLYYVISLILA